MKIDFALRKGFTITFADLTPQEFNLLEVLETERAAASQKRIDEDNG